MAIFDRFKQGITLLVDSIRLMRNNPRLMLFPVVGAVAGLVFLGIFLSITFGAMAIQPEGGVLLGLLFVYLGMTFISTFFTAALVHQTREVIGGGEVSVSAGLSGAWSVKGKLLIWSAIAATVGVIINGIQSNNSGAGRVIGIAFGIAWTLMTFLIVPVIVFEKTNTVGMFKRSASAFKDTWGETPIGLGGVQLVSFLIAIPFLVIGILVYQITAVLGIGLIVLGFALAFLIAQTLEGVIKTVLYLYATDGKTPSEFDNVDFDRLPSEKNTSTMSTAPTG